MPDHSPPVGLSAAESGRRIHFRFSLSYEEAFEAFLLLADQPGPRLRAVAGLILMALAIILTVLYARRPSHLEYCILALLTLLLYGAVFAWPRARAWRGARAVARATGLYQVTLNTSGYLQTADGARHPLAGDRKARAFETAAVFVLRPDRDHTFCLPKRIMTASEIELTRNLIRAHGLLAPGTPPPPAPPVRPDPPHLSTREKTA